MHLLKNSFFSRTKCARRLIWYMDAFFGCWEIWRQISGFPSYSRINWNFSARLTKKVCIHPMISEILAKIILGNLWISYEWIHEFDPSVAHKSKKLLLICKDDFLLSFLCCVKFRTWLHNIKGSFRSDLINLIFSYLLC